MPHLINGAAGDQVSVLDRGLLYGQSLFETIAVKDTTPLLLSQHLQRLHAGCARLAIPVDLGAIGSEIIQLAGQADESRSVIRATITMGEGGRGYANPHQPQPTRIVSLFEWPERPASYWQEGIELGVSATTLAEQPLLAGLKHGNRLEQLIARADWQDDWQEALLLDQHERVIEATQSNVFLLKDGVLKTPDLHLAGVAGVMREQVLSLADNIAERSEIVSLLLPDFLAADEVFVCNSVIGIWPVKGLQTRRYEEFTASHKLLNLLINNESIPAI